MLSCTSAKIKRPIVTKNFPSTKKSLAVELDLGELLGDARSPQAIAATCPVPCPGRRPACRLPCLRALSRAPLTHSPAASVFAHAPWARPRRPWPCRRPRRRTSLGIPGVALLRRHVASLLQGLSRRVPRPQDLHDERLLARRGGLVRGLCQAASTAIGRHGLGRLALHLGQDACRPGRRGCLRSSALVEAEITAASIVELQLRVESRRCPRGRGRGRPRSCALLQDLRRPRWRPWPPGP